MLAENTLSPLLTIEAKIQSRIARFLSLKEILVNLTRNHPSPIIRDRARTLLNNQIALERASREVFERIRILKSGAWNFSDIISLGQFYYLVERHMRNVSELQQEALQEGHRQVHQQEARVVSHLPYLIGALAVVGMILLIKR